MAHRVISLSERRASQVTRRFSKRLAQDFLDEIAATNPELASLKTKAMVHYIAMESSYLVRSMRERAGLTQKQLADGLGIAQSRIAYLESGKSTQGPTLGTLLRIAFICNQQIVIGDERGGAEPAKVASLQKPEKARQGPGRGMEQSIVRASPLQQAASRPPHKKEQQFE
jgi:transcriptional regulator with XRE-family HTH domain